jgi:hypothetical protein
MNRNTTIILLVIILILGLGFYLSRKDVPETPTDATVNINQPVSTVNETDATPLTNATPDAPLVQTNSNSSTSASTATVTGTVRPNGSATSYWFEYGETTGLGQRTNAQAIGSGYTLLATPGYISGLKSNTQYYYRLSAKNSLGTVNGETYSFSTNNVPPVKVMAPTVKTNAATAVARTSATINGQVNPSGAVTSYWFEYGKENNFGFVTSLQSINGGTDTKSVAANLSGLEPLTKYYYRLNAQNAYGTVTGMMLSFTTPGPASAAEPKVDTTAASNITSSIARLNARVNPNGDTTTYWFVYSEDSLLGSLIGSGTTKQVLEASTSTTSVSSTINNLKGKTKYYYRVIAENKYGTAQGDIESFTTR